MGFSHILKLLKLYFLNIFQGQKLEQDTSKGIIMSTQSLVLQHVSVDAVGDYTCRAVNVEGAGESNPVSLKIMCKFNNNTFSSLILMPGCSNRTFLQLI